MTMDCLSFSICDWASEVRREKAQHEKVRRVEALLEEVELAVLRLEVLPLNSLLPQKARLVALQLKVERLGLHELLGLHERLGLRGLFEWILSIHVLRQKWRLEDLLCNLLRHERRREELIRYFLAMLWQKLLESLLFSGNVSEFPNKHRPPCTTMPWNIRPALVVLWGVCWMFNPWSPIDDIQLQPLSAGEQTLFSNSGKVFPHSNVHFVQLTFST
jgi:hypothetical protein